MKKHNSNQTPKDLDYVIERIQQLLAGKNCPRKNNIYLDTQYGRLDLGKLDHDAAYREVCNLALKYKQSYPDALPKLPQAISDVYQRLQNLLEWCINVKQHRQKNEAKETSGKAEEKITKLTDFIRDKCEDTTSISSKVNRIHEFVKNRKISFMPKPVNNTKRNETKLYKEKELQEIWPKLKQKIKSLPNLKV